jgi:hypothetical protein
MRAHLKGSANGNFKHGHRPEGKPTPEYSAWCSLRERCRPGSKDYARYGARGITVCERWSAFTNFLADMGLRPSPLHSIERKDNNGPYSPDNCKWATDIEQSNNKRNNVWLEFQEKRLTLAGWDRELGLRRGTVKLRYERHPDWPLSRILTAGRLSPDGLWRMLPLRKLTKPRTD